MSSEGAFWVRDRCAEEASFVVAAQFQVEGRRDLGPCEVSAFRGLVSEEASDLGKMTPLVLETRCFLNTTLKFLLRIVVFVINKAR